MITRIGQGGPVVVAIDAQGWQLIVRNQQHANGVDSDDLHDALRELALRESSLAPVAFGVICNCGGSWEDEYTEERDESALSFEDWMERIQTENPTFVNEKGELENGF